MCVYIKTLKYKLNTLISYMVNNKCAASLRYIEFTNSLIML